MNTTNNTPQNANQDNAKTFIYKPVFALWIVFKDRGKITQYSRELRNTIRQIKYRKETPVIDIQFAIKRLRELLDEKKERISRAKIYHNDPANLDEKGTEVLEFLNGKIQFDNIEKIPMFQTANILQDVENHYSEWIYNEIQTCNHCIDMSNKGEKVF